MTALRYLSVCSGIEAATQAWHPLGWEPVAFSEIEPFPAAVLAHHYPTVPNWGDMTKFKEWPDATVDVLVGGTPCQSFSVAGLRKGMDDPRGNLALTYLAIAGRYRPRWLVWENVPGVLSSNGGRDFGSFLGGLGKLGYGFAYRVLDAQVVRTRRYPWAVPQRRRRVFVVGYFGDWRRAAAVLFDGESLSGNSPPRREAGQGLAADAEKRAGDGGGDSLIPAVPPALKARDAKGPSSDGDGDGAPILPCVAHALRGEGFDASEDGTGRGTPLIAFSGVDNGADAVKNLAPTMRRAGGGGQALAIAIQERAVSENLDNGPQGKGFQEGHAYTLEARNKVQAVAFAENQHGALREADVSMAISSGGGKPGQGYQAVRQGYAVRRLTPIECERLQGFPDDFTRIPYRNKPADQCPDGPRYKALSNSMAVNVMDWIGQRIAIVEAMP